MSLTGHVALEKSGHLCEPHLPFLPCGDGSHGSSTGLCGGQMGLLCWHKEREGSVIYCPGQESSIARSQSQGHVPEATLPQLLEHPGLWSSHLLWPGACPSPASALGLCPGPAVTLCPHARLSSSSLVHSDTCMTHSLLGPWPPQPSEAAALTPSLSRWPFPRQLTEDGKHAGSLSSSALSGLTTLGSH